MMKMMMRPQKKQMQPTTFRWVNGQSGTFDKRPYVQAGYTTFDVLIVGAAGGKSGRAGNSSRGYAYPSGGGGGASKRITGLLSTLNPETTGYAGVKGDDGSDSGVSQVLSSREGPVTVKAWAGDGEDGVRSFFGAWQAEGGHGGKGGEVAGSDEGVERITRAVGGFGGNQTDTGAGTWNDTTGVGQGGNGGSGKVTGGASAGTGTAGNKTSQYEAPAEGVIGNSAGTGGGCDLAPINGYDHEYWGSGSTTMAGGAVFLRIS